MPRVPDPICKPPSASWAGGWPWPRPLVAAGALLVVATRGSECDARRSTREADERELFAGSVALDVSALSDATAPLTAVLRTGQPSFVQLQSPQLRLVSDLRRLWHWRHIADGLPQVYATNATDNLLSYAAPGAILQELPGQALFRSQRPFLLGSRQLLTALGAQGAFCDVNCRDAQRIFGSVRASTVLLQYVEGQVAQVNGQLGDDARILVEAFFAELSSSLKQDQGQENALFSQAQANLWLGSANSTTLAHYDARDNIFLQLHGRKRVYLLPPNSSAALPPHPCLSLGHRSVRDGAGLHDALTANGSAAPLHPSGDTASALLAEVVPGDVLYIPAFWTHHVVTARDEASASLALWTQPPHIAPDLLDIILRDGQPLWPPRIAREVWDPGERFTASMLLLRAYAGPDRVTAVLDHIHARYHGLVPVLELPAAAKRGFCGVGDTPDAVSHLWPGGTVVAMKRINEEAVAVVSCGPPAAEEGQRRSQSVCCAAAPRLTHDTRCTPGSTVNWRLLDPRCRSPSWLMQGSGSLLGRWALTTGEKIAPHLRAGNGSLSSFFNALHGLP